MERHNFFSFVIGVELTFSPNGGIWLRVFENWVLRKIFVII
jgi:hypothetical protein